MDIITSYCWALKGIFQISTPPCHVNTPAWYFANPACFPSYLYNIQLFIQSYPWKFPIVIPSTCHNLFHMMSWDDWLATHLFCTYSTQKNNPTIPQPLASKQPIWPQPILGLPSTLHLVQNGDTDYSELNTVCRGHVQLWSYHPFYSFAGNGNPRRCHMEDIQHIPLAPSVVTLLPHADLPALMPLEHSRTHWFQSHLGLGHIDGNWSKLDSHHCVPFRWLLPK